MMSQLPIYIYIYQVSIEGPLPEVMPQAQAVGIPASAMTTSGDERGGVGFRQSLWGKGP